MTLDLFIKLFGVAITIGGYVWGLSAAFMRIKQNEKDIKELKEKSDLTTNLLNEISKSIAEINVKLGFLMKEKEKSNG